MIDLLTQLLAQMSEVLNKAGITSWEFLLKETVDHVRVYDSLVKLKQKEYTVYAETRALCTEKTWAYYEARGIKKLREVKMLKQARRDLRRVWFRTIVAFHGA